MPIDDGGPAFASGYLTGMSLRDYFAGQCIVGFSQYWGNTTSVVLAQRAYELADAMIAEKKKANAPPR